MSGLGSDNNTFRGVGGPAPNTDGPHKSDMLNKADPRVDSDRDHSKNMGLNPHGTARTDNNPESGYTGGLAGSRNEFGSHTTGTEFGSRTTGNEFGSTGRTTGTEFGSTGRTTGTEFGSTTAREGEFGTHNSRLANAADPRIDSDLDNSRTIGSTGHSTSTRTHGTTGGLSSGLGSSTTSGAREGEFGTHNSRAANAADPRIDSDLDNSRTIGSTGHSTTARTHGTTGTTGGLTGTSGAREGEFGAHNSRAANAADPRIDSDRDGSRTLGGSHSTGTHTTGTHTTGTHTTGTHGTHGTHSGSNVHSHSAAATGPAPNTAGPHKSDMLNKLDPRVDSDLDGSKTIGGNKTFTE